MAVRIIAKLDVKFPRQYIKDCCNYMDITMQEYHDAIEKFRSPHLWHKVNSNWELKNPIWKKS